MKKTLIAALVFAAGIGSAFAQKPADCNTVCPEQQKCAKADSPRPAKCCAANPFEGLGLTAEQQTKIDALKANCKAVRSERKNEREGRAADFKARRTEMLAKVKDILTPEQYVKFLENNFVNAPAGKPGKDIKGKRHERR